MTAAALASVISGSLVAIAVSSAVVQLQPTSVLVSAAPSVPTARPAAPAYLRVAQGSHVVLGSTTLPGHVGAQACSAVWTSLGKCPGWRTVLLRPTLLKKQLAVVVPVAAPYLRVDVSAGAVEVRTGS
jgi:hypothetical protein